MAIYKNTPPIATNGLVLHLDAGNRMSYPGSGTTWTDLSGNRNTGTLTNGPTFNSANQGSIALNGTNQYINFGSSFLSLDLVDKSFIAWINKIGASQKGIIDKDFDGGGASYGGWGFWIQPNNKLWWWSQGSQDITDNGPNTITLNAWNQVAVTFNSTTKTASFYINGVLNSSIANTNIVEKSSGAALLIVGGLRNNLSPFSFDGNISNVLAYNRILSAQEVAQNYNALKSRFGLT